MSTKTSIKRIALVAVSALGFGLLSVVPSNATISAATYTSTVTNTTNTGADAAPIPAGTALTADLKITTTGAAVLADTGTATFTVTAGPASKDITATCTFAANAAIAANWTVALTTAATGTFTVTAAAAAAAATYTIGTVSCPTTIGGAYVITPTGALTTPAITPTKTAVTAYVSGGNVSQGLTRSTTTGTAAVNGSATVLFTLPTHAAAATAYNIVSSGVGSITTASASDSAAGAPVVTRVNGSTSDYSAGAIVTTAATTDLVTASVSVTSAVAGVQTLELSSTNATTGVRTTISTVTVTWGSVAGISASFTSAVSYIADGAAIPTATTQALSGLLYPRTADGTVNACIKIDVRDAANVAMNGVALSATISGPGLITLASGNAGCTAGLVRTQSLTAATQAATNLAQIGISGDGTAGKATITVSSGSTTLFTKTVYFYGTVAKLTATQNFSILKASSTSGGTLGSAVAAPAGTSVGTTPAVIIVATDANGTLVPGLTITAKSSDTSLIASATVVQSDGSAAGDGYAGAGSYNASVTSAVGAKSGSSATLTFRTLLADGVTYVSADPLTFTFGGSAYTGSFAMNFDKAAYEPGEAAKLTVTGKDSSGNPIFDQDLNLWAGLGSAPVFSRAVQGSVPSSAASTMFVGGKKTYKMYAPVTEGNFNVTGTLDALTVASGAALTATAKVENGAATVAANAATDAAAEAIDAANAATDAANLAAEAADAATVAAEEARDAADAATAAVEKLAADVATLMASLKAQITTLANTVAKIAKKVKA